MKSESLVVLDRDGLINVDFGYVHTRDNFQFMPGIFELCSLFTKHGMTIVVATNQSGIARNFYSEKEFDDLSEWMVAEFRSRGIEISKVYRCPHLPKETQTNISSTNAGCSCRKPQPGMLLDAIRDFEKDARNCIILGDKETDMLAGLNAGFETRILVGDENTSTSCTERFADLSGAFDYFKAKLETSEIS
ncbi:D-glycero-alpha-D-manno-heptose-1,7-bisphosphate 7-phosphatase [Rhodoluna lacicola]|uniref:D-glycero-alpha-D-manno-heptose-1,7-bisphosphate 7-phosphatase n=1 Tax=Rhodoluna lacicola TaxID=529884 RepID=UPI00222FC48D|nr:HAD family hydrolase [Rhodoluna lacicola]